jgi:hypothetical protein
LLERGGQVAIAATHDRFADLGKEPSRTPRSHLASLSWVEMSSGERHRNVEEEHDGWRRPHDEWRPGTPLGTQPAQPQPRWMV